ncbi:hypothetical protein K438DRAFT_1747997 [Mycena galopus ATCC 62051]|nr:hypothetical protein K438DRAFT_1747997 [Mycena galopus ATCC 62051]
MLSRAASTPARRLQVCYISQTIFAEAGAYSTQKAVRILIREEMEKYCKTTVDGNGNTLDDYGAETVEVIGTAHKGGFYSQEPFHLNVRIIKGDGTYLPTVNPYTGQQTDHHHIVFPGISDKHTLKAAAAARQSTPVATRRRAVSNAGYSSRQSGPPAYVQQPPQPFPQPPQQYAQQQYSQQQYSQQPPQQYAQQQYSQQQYSQQPPQPYAQQQYAQQPPQPFPQSPQSGYGQHSGQPGYGQHPMGPGSGGFGLRGRGGAGGSVAYPQGNSGVAPPQSSNRRRRNSVNASAGGQWNVSGFGLSGGS